MEYKGSYDIKYGSNVFILITGRNFFNTNCKFSIEDWGETDDNGK
jgi:hypothetical protein